MVDPGLRTTRSIPSTEEDQQQERLVSQALVGATVGGILSSPHEAEHLAQIQNGRTVMLACAGLLTRTFIEKLRMLTGKLSASSDDAADAHGTSGSGTAVKFDGASAGSQQALSTWLDTCKCGECGEAYPLASVTAFLHADKTFVTEDNQNFTKATVALVKEGVEPFWSYRYSATKTIAQQLVCIHCWDAPKKGRGWVECMGPLCTFHYGCGYCSSFPTKSSSWYRAIEKTKALEEGMSSLGESHGYWLCAAAGCLKRWSWAVGGHRRLLVIGSEDMISSGNYYFAYVSEVSSACENKINLLKSLTMLQVIGSRIITPEVICRVIDEVNTTTDKKLCKGVKEITTRVSGDVSDLDCQLYCEHKSLSLPKPGIVFKIIDLQGRTDVPTFVDDELSEFLDTLASFMNVDMLSAQDLQPAQRTAQRNILNSAAYLRARARVVAICDHVVPPALGHERTRIPA